MIGRGSVRLAVAGCGAVWLARVRHDAVGSGLVRRACVRFGTVGHSRFR